MQPFIEKAIDFIMVNIGFSPSLRLRGVPACAALCFSTLCLSVLLSGCGINTVDRSVSGALKLNGTVHGGQQPVNGARIKLYTVGTTGYGSASTSLIATAVASDANGNFSITGDYSCASSTEQVYIVAGGGNPGLAVGTDNQALVLMSALGNCGNVPTLPFLEINEVTTAAATWALAPFFTTASGTALYDHIGSSSTNPQGIANAMLNAQLLVDPTTGLAATLPSSLTVETAKLYSLADALAPCVNSDGTTGCTPLFTAATPAGGTAPATTLSAALSIVRNPGQNVVAVFNAMNAQAPFPGALTVAPNDWTMSLTVTGGGIDSPAALGIDSYNNIWVANAGDQTTSSVLSAFSAQGTPYTSTGYGSGTLSESYGLTVDRCNNIWVGNEEEPRRSNHTYGSISAFVGVPPAAATGCAGSGPMGGLLDGTSYFADNSIDFPLALASDPNGDILIANYAGSSATVYNGTGGLVEASVGAGNAAFPLAIAADAAHGIWLANQGDDTVTHIAANGNIFRPACCDGAEGIAIDSLGNAWVANYYGASVSEISSSGVVVIDSDTNGGVADGYSDGIAVDGGQNIWVANYLGNTISELAGNSSTLAAGTGISPATGYGPDTGLLEPYGIALDTGGNVWVTSSANDLLIMFFGLATPTQTPLVPVPAIP